MTQRYYSSTAIQTSGTTNISAVDAQLVVSATTGWPIQYPFSLILDEDTVSEEIVTVSNVTGLTVSLSERGADGTTGQSHTVGYSVRHGFSARDFRDSRTHEAATTGVHGVTGTVVGTTDTQTLTNKTLASPVVTGTFPTHGHTSGSDGGTITALVNHIAATNNVHGTTSAVVGVADAQTLTNKTLTAPVVADFTNATHDHSAANKGGNIPESSVTNLVTDLAAKLPLGGGTMTGPITLSADPAAALQPATKQYVDARNLWARKTVDESVSNSAALQNDDVLTLNLVANQTYYLKMVLRVTGQSGGDFKWTLTVPAGAAGSGAIISGTYAALNGSGDCPAVTNTFTHNTTGGGVIQPVILEAAIVMAGTAGAVQLQWAQNTSNGTATVVKAGSFMRAELVA